MSSLNSIIVTIDLFCRMLGGIGDGTARKLLRGNHVEHFYIRNTYFIPKVSIIDYLLSSDYESEKESGSESLFHQMMNKYVQHE